DRDTEYFRSEYKYRPILDGVAVCGSSSRDVVVSGEVVPADKVHITGFPRFDPWLPLLRQPLGWDRGDEITLMSYAGAGYRATDHFPEMLKQFAELSEKYKDGMTRFVVKAKHIGDMHDITKILAGFPPHCVVVTAEPLFDALQYSKAVI